MAMSVFEELGLRRIVNAAGKLTVLGASVISDETAAAMVEAGQHFVDLAELMRAADRLIAQATSAEAGFITSCAAAGISISTAACLTRGDLARTESLPFLASPPDEILIQRGHSIHFGGSILQMMALTGAKVIEIGATNRTLP
ncbi:MAG: SelA-like pyridoxal phosphate-dependent enzyme, partial [Anaerolineae bacterium]